MVLLSDLRGHVHLVDFESGRIEFRPSADAPKELANVLGKKLSAWTGERWIAVVSGEDGAPTLAEQEVEARAQRIAAAKQHPLVAAALETFADAEITDVRDRAAPDAVTQNGDETP